MFSSHKQARIIINTPNKIILLKKKKQLVYNHLLVLAMIF